METSVLLSLDDKLAMMEVADEITLDTEGSGMMLGYSVAFDGLQQGLYLPYQHSKGNLSKSQQDKAAQIIHSRKALIFHNAVHDLRVLANFGIDYRGWFWDTMLMAHWVNEERPAYDLTSISKAYGGEPKEMPEQMKRLIESDGWNVTPVAWMDEYSSHDAFITHKLFRKLEPEFQRDGFQAPSEYQFSLDLWAKEQDFIRDVMGPMMDLGIKVDVAFAIREYMRGQGIMEECIKELGFKPTSPKALKSFLIDELELPVVKHTKACKKCYPLDRRIRSVPVETHGANPSFDKDAMAIYETMLEHKDDPRATTILRYRGWLKTNSSNYKPYMELVDDAHVLHPGYKLHGTKTGRLSCADPNLQQIPKSSSKDWNGNLKAAFIAREGYDLWTIDYSQLQFRMTVAYAGCQTLIDIFNDPTRDIFTEMAGQMGWLRDDVKTLVYLILFGGGAKRASVAFNTSVEEGGSLVSEFHALYPEIKQIAKDCEIVARKQGYVAYWTGRRRHFPRGAAFYRAFNAVIQGGEAEIIKRAMIRIQKELCNEEFRMILQIHDEIAFEIAKGRETFYLPKAQQIMEEVCEEFCKFVEVKVRFATQAKRWGEK